MKINKKKQMKISLDDTNNVVLGGTSSVLTRDEAAATLGAVTTVVDVYDQPNVAVDGGELPAMRIAAVQGKYDAFTPVRPFKAINPAYKNSHFTTGTGGTLFNVGDVSGPANVTAMLMPVAFTYGGFVQSQVAAITGTASTMLHDYRLDKIVKWAKSEKKVYTSLSGTVNNANTKEYNAVKASGLFALHGKSNMTQAEFCSLMYTIITGLRNATNTTETMTALGNLIKAQDTGSTHIWESIYECYDNPVDIAGYALSYIHYFATSAATLPNTPSCKVSGSGAKKSDVTFRYAVATANDMTYDSFNYTSSPEFSNLVREIAASDVKEWSPYQIAFARKAIAFKQQAIARNDSINPCYTWSIGKIYDAMINVEQKVARAVHKIAVVESILQWEQIINAGSPRWAHYLRKIFQNSCEIEHALAAAKTALTGVPVCAGLFEREFEMLKPTLAPGLQRRRCKIIIPYLASDNEWISAIFPIDFGISQGIDPNVLIDIPGDEYYANPDYLIKSIREIAKEFSNDTDMNLRAGVAGYAGIDTWNLSMYKLNGLKANLSLIKSAAQRRRIVAASSTSASSGFPTNTTHDCGISTFRLSDAHHIYLYDGGFTAYNHVSQTLANYALDSYVCLYGLKKEFDHNVLLSNVNGRPFDPSTEHMTTYVGDDPGTTAQNITSTSTNTGFKMTVDFVLGDRLYTGDSQYFFATSILNDEFAAASPTAGLAVFSMGCFKQDNAISFLTTIQTGSDVDEIAEITQGLWSLSNQATVATAAIEAYKRIGKANHGNLNPIDACMSVKGFAYLEDCGWAGTARVGVYAPIGAYDTSSTAAYGSDWVNHYYVQLQTILNSFGVVNALSFCAATKVSGNANPCIPSPYIFFPAYTYAGMGQLGQYEVSTVNDQFFTVLATKTVF